MRAKLYSTTFCPYGWCARIVLNEKGVPFDEFEVDLKAEQAEFLDVSPASRVPVFVDGGTRICESMVINEYLEEKYPEPKLFGITPEERAAVRTVVLDFNCNRSRPLAKLASMLLYHAETRDDLQVRRQLRMWYQYLDELEEHFETHQWLASDRFSIADICLFTTVSISQGFGMELGDRRYLEAWFDRVTRRDSVQRSAPQTIPSFV